MYTGSDWEGVSLEEFLNCPYNLAHNRQTRMIANLTLIGCYNQSIIPDKTERERLMLQSAKDNLRRMAFFGLTEYLEDTQFLFEQTFRNGIRFNKRFVQYNETHASKVELSQDLQAKLQHRNSLDIELYQYAKQLFFERLERARRTTSGAQKFSSSSKSSSSKTSSSSSLSQPGSPSKLQGQSIKFFDGLESYDNEDQADDYDEDDRKEESKTSEISARVRQQRRTSVVSDTLR